jgi:hypothetical protein
MPGNATSNRVLSGLYAGFTRAEMLIEWDRYKAALQKSGSRLQGATVNGQNVQFGPRADLSLTSWGRAIRQALAQVDPDWIAPTQTIRVGFGCDRQGFGVNGNGIG